MRSAPAAARGFFPLDEALALLPGQFAPRIVEGIVRLGVWMPFERVPEVFAFFTGVTVSAETVRRLTEEAGAAQVAVERAAVERLEADPPVAPQGPAIQQMSVDGAMVPLVGGAWAEVKTLAIGAVTRTATGAVQTTALSYFSRLSDAEQFTRWARGETERRGTETAGIVCAVGDGAEWLQHFVDQHRPDAVRILDFPHAAQRVCAAAQAVWGAGTAATSTWLDDQLHCLKHGDPIVVLAALRALPVVEAPSPVEAALTRDTVVAYLTTRWEQIQYARFRALGYPIGSGIVESGNKLVVEGRLKGSGMHWARANVTPMVALRAMACSERWAEAWPTIWQAWRARRQADRVQQAAAHRAKRTAPVAAVPTRPPLPAPATSSPVPRPRLVVDGRPTANHPWRKRLLPSRPATTMPANP